MAESGSAFFRTDAEYLYLKALFPYRKKLSESP